MMTLQQLKPIMPDIIAAIETPGWSVMHSGGVRHDGLAFLAENLIEEGLPQLMKIMDPDNPRGNEAYKFAPGVLKHFEHYRGAAKPYLPQLKEYAKRYRAHRSLGKNERFHEQMQKMIETIEKDDNPPKLVSWKSL